jgi:hypothetical protein
LLQFRMVLTMDGTNLVEERSEASHFFPCVLVVGIRDVRDEIGERLCLPIADGLHSPSRVVSHL